MNKRNKIYDVIIVGAGPAGLSTALECARNKLSVLLIEESPLLETEKSWITFSDTLKNYPLVKKAVTNTAHRLKLHTSKDSFDSNKTLIEGHFVEQALMNKAYKEELEKCNTVDILDKTVYQKGKRGNNLVKVKTSKGVFKAKIIADCSGSYSIAAEDLSVPNENFWLFMCYFLRIYRKDALENYDCIVFSSGGSNPSSIGMAGGLYPNSKDYFDIGIADYLKRGRDTGKMKSKLKRQIINLWNFFQKEGLIKKNIKIDFTKEFYGGIRMTPRKHIYDDNIVLVGDAAGQGSPITGEGLRTGLYYGEIAGKVISEAIKKNDLSKQMLKKYSDLCKKNPLYGYGYGLLTQKLIRNNLVFDRPLKKLQSLYNKNQYFWGKLIVKILRSEPLSLKEIVKSLLRFYFTKR